jgi:hypothetical protein
VTVSWYFFMIRSPCDSGIGGRRNGKERRVDRAPLDDAIKTLK